jgi:tetratricopeptide (TPR) repeat protein
VLQHNRGSVLLAIEVRALMAVGDIEEALAVAARAIPEAEETGSRDSLGTLLVTAAAAAEQLGRWDEAVEYLRRAERVADAQQDPVAELDLSAQRFRILYENMPDSPELKVIANDIANRYFSLSNETLINNDAVLRHVAAAVGPIRPDVLGRALKLVEIPPLEPEQRKMLVSALESKEGTPEQVWLADSFRRTLDLPPPPQWRTIVDAASNTSRLGDFMQRILAAEHGDNRIGVTLAELIDTSTHSHHHMRP